MEAPKTAKLTTRATPARFEKRRVTTANCPVFLARISLRNFRNFENEVIELPQEGAALIGANGQGKTNLLEAIYYLEIFRSFRGARDDQLVNFGAEYFRVEAHVACVDDGEGGEAVEVAAGYVRDGRRKKVTINGGEAARMAEGIGRIGAIIFTASDVEMVAGGPGARRRFLDIALSLVEPSYLADLQRYRQILTQRNELLRERGDASSLAAWNDGLVAVGSRIMQARARWISDARPRFSRHCEAISGGEEAAMEYAPSVSMINGEQADGSKPTREEWESAFREQLDRLRERERRRGVTVVGPHRDDLRLGLLGRRDQLSLRAFGSAGQQRTAAIALRMVEAETWRESRGRRPIVMLDDVFAELDPQRATRMFEMLSSQEWGQVIVTSPKPDDYALMGGRLSEYRIERGRVNRV